MPGVLNPQRGIPIYLIRHGATHLNADNVNSVDKIRGWSDVPLTDEGRKEAEQIGQQLKGRGIRSIVTSDLSRAKETADIIGKHIGVKPVSSKDLRPWDLGELTGKDTEKCLPAIADYVHNKPDKAVPKGESFQSFHKRAFKGIDEAVKNHPAPVAIVTHHRVERLLKAWDETGQDNPRIDLGTFLSRGEAPGHAAAGHLSYYPGSQKPVAQAKPETGVLGRMTA